MKIINRKITMSGAGKTTRYQICGITLLKKHKSATKRYLKILNFPIYGRKKRSLDFTEEVQSFFGLPILKKRTKGNQIKKYLLGIQVRREKVLETSLPQVAGIVKSDMEYPHASPMRTRSIVIIVGDDSDETTVDLVERCRKISKAEGFDVCVCQAKNVCECIDALQFASCAVLIGTFENSIVSCILREISRLSIEILSTGTAEPSEGSHRKTYVIDESSFSSSLSSVSCNIDNSPQKESILHVNVLYGISSHGGATVVAEALAEKIQDLSMYQSIVFTTHTDPVLPIGALRRYDWNGVHVISYNTNGVSLEYWNEQVDSAFEKILHIYRPVLSHVHCIQTIGMGVVYKCVSCKIPYVITIHDGWWRCHRQFMLDLNETYCGKCAMNCSLCKERCSIPLHEYYNRLKKAEFCLENADKVYTPSHYFTNLVKRDFKLKSLKTNVNGILDSMFTKVEKIRSSKIRFGFFGGPFHLKGYFMLKDVLAEYPDDKYEVLLIDSNSKLNPGGMQRDGWGDNATIVEYVQHDKMADLYRQIDVLLFPSLLEESFGLMVREAVANDAFVICSECGGPLEAIVHGKNGLVFPMGDKQKFKECIDYVFAHQQDILNYRTTEFGDVRTFEIQAKELLEDYKKIVKRVEGV